MAASDSITPAEAQLLGIACRIDTALRYRDEHKEAVDDSWYNQALENELDEVNEVFEKEDACVPRMHPLLRMVGEESVRVGNGDMELDRFSIDAIREACKAFSSANPGFNPVLSLADVRRLASNVPDMVEWWLPGEPTFEDEEAAEDAAAEAAGGEGDDDDEVAEVESASTGASSGPRRSGRNSKVKVSGHTDEDSTGDDIIMLDNPDVEATPRKPRATKRPQAVVVSPSSDIPAKRRQRKASTSAKAKGKGKESLPDPGIREKLNSRRPKERWEASDESQRRGKPEVLLNSRSDTRTQAGERSVPAYYLYTDKYSQWHKALGIVSVSINVSANQNAYSNQKGSRYLSIRTHDSPIEVQHVMLMSNAKECVPQVNAPKAIACALCRSRKVQCQPPPAWALPIIESIEHSKLAKEERKQQLPWRRSAASVFDDMTLTLDSLKRGQERLEERLAALQIGQNNLELLLRALCMRHDVIPSTLNLHTPPVPLFNSASAVSPSIASTLSTTASTAASTSSTGVDVSRLSISASPATGSSGSGAGNVPANVSTGRSGATIKPASRAPSVSRAPSAPGSRASLRSRP
ncbi:hypothetical protein H4582DRAFT_2062066 [Lactarius indigo]|nr:hypothetical protein H4582DRAFT_2062066 [Lactarius indigo]